MHVGLVHGSNDLYGASRVLLQDVDVLHALDSRVSVVLPTDGPLTAELEKRGARVAIEEVAVLRAVDFPRGLRVPVRLPGMLSSADVLVLYTLALSPSLPAARRQGVFTVLSVHEILESRAGRALATAGGLLADSIMV